jgi:hypothetical protein
MRPAAPTCWQVKYVKGATSSSSASLSFSLTLDRENCGEGGLVLSGPVLAGGRVTTRAPDMLP